jgi:hypothetical protein
VGLVELNSFVFSQIKPIKEGHYDFAQYGLANFTQKYRNCPDCRSEKQPRSEIVDLELKKKVHARAI